MRAKILIFDGHFLLCFKNTIFLMVAISQVQAQMTLKHGFYLSQSVGNIDADISGKHQDFAAFTGSNFGAITEKNATIYDGKISNSRSFGYNLRYTPSSFHI
jgi:hypothetical protein